LGEIVDILEYRTQKEETQKMTKLEYEARIVYLESYLTEKHKMRSYDLQLEELEQDYGPGARSLSGMPSGGKKGDCSDRIIRRMEDKARFAAEYARHRDAAMREMAGIEKVICEISPKLQNVLRFRYMNDMDIHQIAVEVNYSYRQVQRHHQLAIERIRPPRHRIDRIKRELLELHPEWAMIEIKSA